MQGQVVLGRAAFVDTLQPLLAGQAAVQEIPRMQRLVARPPVEEIVPARGGATTAKRDRAIWKAHVRYGYSLAAVGKHLGLHYTTISKIVQRQQSRQTKTK